MKISHRNSPGWWTAILAIAERKCEKFNSIGSFGIIDFSTTYFFKRYFYGWIFNHFYCTLNIIILMNDVLFIKDTLFIIGFGFILVPVWSRATDRKRQWLYEAWNNIFNEYFKVHNIHILFNDLDTLRSRFTAYWKPQFQGCLVQIGI